MPVMYNAQVFPRFFATNENLGLAYLPKDVQIEQLQENRSLHLAGSLCFHIKEDVEQSTHHTKQFLFCMAEGSHSRQPQF